MNIFTLILPLSLSLINCIIRYVIQDVSFEFIACAFWNVLYMSQEKSYWLDTVGKVLVSKVYRPSDSTVKSANFNSNLCVNNRNSLHTVSQNLCGVLSLYFWMLCSKLNLCVCFNVKLIIYDVLNLQTGCLCSPENAAIFISAESLRHKSHTAKGWFLTCSSLIYRRVVFNVTTM
jgi:hypothetical protein